VNPKTVGEIDLSLPTIATTETVANSEWFDRNYIDELQVIVDVKDTSENSMYNDIIETSLVRDFLKRVLIDPNFKINGVHYKIDCDSPHSSGFLYDSDTKTSIIYFKDNDGATTTLTVPFRLYDMEWSTSNNG